MTTENAVVVREEGNPLVAQIDAKMPEIAGMLPEGMRPERFRKVVVQALLRNPKLWECTPVSVVTSITEAAEVGIEPTGVLGKGWLLPYWNKDISASEAKFIIGWRGLVDLLWRADKLLVTPELVRAGDEFEYRRGTGAYLHHVPALGDASREKDAGNITFAYVLVRFPDGREEFEVMSRADIERIRDRARNRNPVWGSDFGEMAKKTPIRRIAKRLPLSPAAQRIIAGEESADFDTPIERYSIAPRAALAEGIASRRAAIEAASSETPAGGVSTDGEVVTPSTASPSAPCDHVGSAHIATDEGVKCSRCGELLATGRAKAPRARRTAPAAKKPGDEGYGTARAHAVASERGLDHDAVHRIAEDMVTLGGTTYLVPFSLTNLTEPQWQLLILAISEAPIVDNDKDAERYAGSMALAAGIGDGDNPWPEADPMLADMFGHGDPFSAAELIEFGIRVTARNPLP